jgi:hypothetical protein
MMRLTITTYNVLEMLGNWDIARPYNFLLLPMVDPTFGYAFNRACKRKGPAGGRIFVQAGELV